MRQPIVGFIYKDGDNPQRKWEKGFIGLIRFMVSNVQVQLLRVFLSSALCLLCPEPHAQNLPKPIVKAFKAQVPLNAVSIYAQEVTAQNQTTPSLINWQTDMPMQPASTMKLVTSYAALDLLGPTYTWQTSVFATGILKDDVLVGDLIVQGGGDPHLVLENFWMLLRQIRAKGVRKIQGNLVLDTSWMEAQTFDAVEFDGDPMRPYNVGPDALLVNFNVLELQLRQSAKKLQVDAFTPLAFSSQVNVRLVKEACTNWRDKLTPVFSLLNQQIHLQLRGTYPQGCPNQSWLLQPYPLSHNDFVGALFRELWKELGGQFHGEVRAGIVPPTAELLTTYQSQPLADVLRDMNKYSNNVMTRLVLLTLDKESTQLPANATRAAQSVQQWFAHLGISAQGLQVENGSGLSRHEQISTAQMGRMLNHAFFSPVMPELLSSLPVLGKDGTMKKRAVQLSVAGHAHIKSGGLDKVRNFAGYVQAASGKRYVVVCFVNHANAQQTESAQDALLQWVYEHG
jgi:D-alanyl-D-alanine carboxypeptidase/D-alanyl-D-alanine-endopeptidase (penicillin-binding protein 4)